MEKPTPAVAVAWNRLVIRLYGATTGSGAKEPQPVTSRSSEFWVLPDQTYGETHNLVKVSINPFLFCLVHVLLYPEIIVDLKKCQFLIVP